MAKVVLAPFIESISGKVGNLQFRTLKSGRTVVHARRCTTEDGIMHRATPPTPAERQQIWLRVKYLYDKHVNEVKDEKELRQLILEKYDKSTLKPAQNPVLLRKK